jgi:hypothetical protein
MREEAGRKGAIG